MSPTTGLWTPDKVTQLIDRLREGGNVTDVIRQLLPNLSRSEMAYQLQRGMQLVGQVATENSGTIGKHAVEALEVAQESIPEATEQLVRVVNVGGQHARAALDSIKQLPPSTILSCLRQFGTNASVYAEELVAHLGTMAKTGNVAAKEALEEIEQNPGLFGGLALAARAILQSLAGLIAGISTTALVIGAVAAVAVVGLAGAIWSRGDSSVKPGSAMIGRTATQPPITQTGNATGPFNCKQWCKDHSSAAPADYMPCTTIGASVTGNEQACAAASATAKGAK